MKTYNPKTFIRAAAIAREEGHLTGSIGWISRIRELLPQLEP